jgi:hypothetical protein
MRILLFLLISFISINATGDVGCKSEDKKEGYFETVQIKESKGKIKNFLYESQITGQGGCTMEANSNDLGTIWTYNNQETTIKFKDSPQTLVTITQGKDKTEISIDGNIMYFCGKSMGMPEKVIIQKGKKISKCKTIDSGERW